MSTVDSNQRSGLSAAIAADVLNSLTSHIAVLDSSSVIIGINDAWRRFAIENNCESKSFYLGTNYLATCEDAVRYGGDESAKACLQGLRDVMGGETDRFTLEYPCHSLAEKRWFVLRVNTFSHEGSPYFVVAHENITARKLAEDGLRQTEQMLQQVLESLPVGVWIMDSTGRIVHGNAASLEIWAGARYVPPEQFGEYKGWWLSTGEPIAADEWAAARAMRNGETSIDEEIEIECFDGTRKIILNSAIPLFDAQQAIRGAIIVNQDITRRKQTETMLRQKQEKWQKLFEILPVGVSVMDQERRIIDINAALEKILHISKAALMSGEYKQRLYLNHENSPMSADDMPSSRAIKEQSIVQNVEICVVTEDGNKVWTIVSAAPLPDQDASAVIVTLDITKRKEVEEKLLQTQKALRKANRRLKQAISREQLLARTDGLTGVFNRRYFIDLATYEFAVAKRYRHPLAVIMFDIDFFKRVNDSLGHPFGDEVLKLVAQIAGAVLRETDVLARYGGEEFIMLIPGSDSPGAAIVAERIRKNIAGRHADSPKGPVSVTISCGVADIVGDGDSLEKLIQRADNALYFAKESGRNRTVIYSKELFCEK